MALTHLHCHLSWAVQQVEREVEVQPLLVLKRYAVEEEKHMRTGLDGQVKAKLEMEMVRGCQLPTKLAHELEEQVDHLLQAVYEKVGGGLFEMEIQPSTRVWLEEAEELSFEAELVDEHCYEREEGEGQHETAWMVLVYLERQYEQVEMQYEQVERQPEKVEEVDGQGELELEEEQGKLSLQEVVGGAGKEQH